MALNRLSRDQIVHRALDMIDSRALDEKDRPGGALQASALALGWLQDGIDHVVRRYPYGAQLASQSYTLALGASTLTIPTDYLLDQRDGLFIYPDGLTRPGYRIRRKSYRWIQDAREIYSKGRTGTPAFYTIKGSTIYLDCVSKAAYSLTFTYYAMPGELDADDIPPFPADYALVEYVRIRGNEWIGAAQAGTALTFATQIVSDLARQGISLEAEDNDTPLEPGQFRPTGNEQSGGSAWLGDSIPR